MPAVSLLATLVATILGFLLGALWYGPLFGKRWMALAGISREQAQRDFNPVVTYGTTCVLGFIASYVLGLYLGPDPGRSFAIATSACPNGADLVRCPSPASEAIMAEVVSRLPEGCSGGCPPSA